MRRRRNSRRRANSATGAGLYDWSESRFGDNSRWEFDDRFWFYHRTERPFISSYDSGSRVTFRSLRLAFQLRTCSGCFAACHLDGDKRRGCCCSDRYIYRHVWFTEPHREPWCNRYTSRGSFVDTHAIYTHRFGNGILSKPKLTLGYLRSAHGAILCYRPWNWNSV